MCVVFCCCCFSWTRVVVPSFRQSAFTPLLWQLSIKKKHISCHYPRPTGFCSPASQAEQMQLFPKGLSSLQPVWIRVGNFNHGLPWEWQSPVSLITSCSKWKSCFFNSLKQSLSLNVFFSIEKVSRMTPMAAIAHIARCISKCLLCRHLNKQCGKQRVTKCWHVMFWRTNMFSRNLSSTLSVVICKKNMKEVLQRDQCLCIERGKIL